MQDGCRRRLRAVSLDSNPLLLRQRPIITQGTLSQRFRIVVRNALDLTGWVRPALLDLVLALSLPLAILLRFTDRQRHELPVHQVAESALIGNGAMPQQLCEHAQSLVGEILVDERFLSD